MLFGKAFFTTFTLAAMAITHVASAPTSQPDMSVVEKRDTISDKMQSCYQQVQTKCNDIGDKITGAGGIIDVDVAADIQVDISAIVDIIVAVVADIQVDIKAGVSVDDLHGCGSTFVLLVNLLVTVLIKIAGACQPAALTILAAIVVKLQVNVQLCATVLLGGIDVLLGGLIGTILSLLASLKIDINACITAFVGACGKF